MVVKIHTFGSLSILIRLSCWTQFRIFFKRNNYKHRKKSFCNKINLTKNCYSLRIPIKASSTYLEIANAHVYLLVME
jgi:hypothetical protein